MYMALENNLVGATIFRLGLPICSHTQLINCERRSCRCEYVDYERAPAKPESSPKTTQPNNPLNPVRNNSKWLPIQDHRLHV